MTIIHARTQDQVLVATILPKVACGNKKTVKLHVEFDSAWDGLTKTAIFYTSNDPTPYPVKMSSTGECTIPHEVLAEVGYLYISIEGADSASRKVKTTALFTGIITIHPHSVCYFSFGHSPNTTGYAQVRLLLACQPCICYETTLKRD